MLFRRVLVMWLWSPGEKSRVRTINPIWGAVVKEKNPL